MSLFFMGKRLGWVQRFRAEKGLEFGFWVVCFLDLCNYVRASGFGTEGV